MATYRLIVIILLMSFSISVCELWGATTLIITPKSVNMGTIISEDYESGYKEKLRANLIILLDTDNDWKLMVKTNDNNMGVIRDYTKPISDFYFRAIGPTATQTVYTSISNYDIEVARGQKTSTLETVYMDYKILLSWFNDVPGEYTIKLIYTLTTQ